VAGRTKPGWAALSPGPFRNASGAAAPARPRPTCARTAARRDFDTLNGIEGNGASVDNASIIAANGLVIMNSGYGLFGQGAGNVMIAFRPKG
jgi:hypothetical protein